MPPDVRIHWENDTAPAEWIATRFHPFCEDTGSVVPEGFDAYCRILHPVNSMNRDGVTTTWSDVAERNGRVAHSGMQFHEINRPAGTPLLDHYQPAPELEWGRCPPDIRASLIKVLRNNTSTPGRCWFCAWDGYGAIDYPKWPDDRTWIVVTEIDYAWTYVGGSDELVNELAGSDEIEAFRVTLNDAPFRDSDLINAALDG